MSGKPRQDRRLQRIRCSLPLIPARLRCAAEMTAKEGRPNDGSTFEIKLNVLWGTPGTPNVDAREQEQPHHVDEMPVPSGEFEAEMPLRRELPARREQADDQEDRADDDVEAVEAVAMKKVAP